MSIPTVLRLTSPDDVLAAVPCLLGFHPESSLALLTVAGATRGFHARVDLPDDVAEREELAGYLGSVCGRHGLSAVALVLYTDDAELARETVAAVSTALVGAGVQVQLAIRADGVRWWPLDSGREPGGSTGTPYDVRSHPLTATFVMAGRVTLGSRAELRASLDVDQEQQRLLVEAVPGVGVPLTDRWVRDTVRRFLRDGTRLAPGVAARLLVALLDVEARDVAWAQMTTATAARHVDLWRDLVRRSPLSLRAAPAGLLGFAAWLSGDGALAWCAVDVCRAGDADYRLAALLSEALAAAVPPSAWTPPPVTLRG